MTKQSKITIETATDVIEYVALSDLYVSDLNPRQEVPEEGIELLAESMIACGLIQNLAGLRDPKGKKVGIVAGGRRYRALLLAVKERPDLAQVPVKMAPDAHTAEQWANTENTARVELDAVDEIRAYGKMAAKSLSLSKISKAFGVTEAHVRRRLALAGLPCPVLDALKLKKISLGQAQAFTVSDNEKLILEVLEKAKTVSWCGEREIKNSLKPDALDGECREMRFVGLKAYKAEGGVYVTDLFNEKVLLDSPDLLSRLFAKKLEDAAAELQKSESWAWVTITEDSNPNFYELQQEHGYAKAHKVEGVLTEEQQARYDELNELEYGDEWNDELAKELAVLETIIEGDYVEAQKTIAGAVAFVRYNGIIDLVRGLIKPEDQEEAIVAGILEEATPETATPKAEKPAYTQKFMDDMTAIRLAGVQTALLEKPEFVLDMLAFALSPATGYYDNSLSISFNNQRNTPDTDDAFILHPRLGGERSEDDEAAFEQVKKLSGKKRHDAFEAFRKLGKKARNAQITQSFARALKTQEGDFMAVIEAEAGASIRSIWTPTAANCFKRLNAGQLEALFMSLLDLKPEDAHAKSFAKAKKGEKAEVLHKLFNEPNEQKALNVTTEQQSRIDAWVPECF
jgi:ParB family transcriptional regulator, chromosome partitioning protein